MRKLTGTQIKLKVAKYLDFACVIAMLLIISGIETNPGPRTTPKQTTIETTSEKEMKEMLVTISENVEGWMERIETRLVLIERGVGNMEKQLQSLERTLTSTTKITVENSKKIAGEKVTSKANDLLPESRGRKMRNVSRLLHAGVQLTLSAIREKYWIPSGRCLVKQILFKCIKCARFRTKAVQQLMGNLPTSRTNWTRPFTKTGIEFAGPVIVKTSNLRNARCDKAYIALFICMFSKAIHIELVTNLTTEAFLAALRRFIGRRGRPAEINTDNATNFVGAYKDLRKLFNSNIHDFASSEEIKWNFIPPSSLHFRGLWEAGIKSVKYHLRRILEQGKTISLFNFTFSYIVYPGEDGLVRVVSVKTADGDLRRAVAKAFDSVPHSLLWKKLTDMGLNYSFVNLIKNYYENMTAVFRWNNSYTEFTKIRSGVLQGEPLSPYLFLLFINDLSKIFDDSNLPGIYLSNFGNIHILLYADDIVLIGESRINLPMNINILKTYLETNFLTLNESKSKIMIFRNGGKPARSEKWYWGQQIINSTQKYLYLGYPLTPSISFTQTALHFKGKVIAAIGSSMGDSYEIQVKFFSLNNEAAR
ncbi:hypothetical protein LAZ67_5003139 [Cordylochernes scorpioides]|uniref:Uncharacterized protein n=1 Tax=Cordylochernes scorpioides TaxID=51811 RepID=A0ABY6KH27_9ARAC|nr:hypothetical protein LAZ67_5003139 [Cordylochernes scorpioides]